jgi:HK97 family phage portal protein
VILTTEQAINGETAERIKEAWIQNYQGYQNTHKPAVMGQGVKIQQLSLTAEDAQLLASRQFQIEEIARAYGVPPFMIGHNEKTTSWGSGVEQMGLAFVRYTLRQHLNKFQTEINRKFFKQASKFVEFDTFELEKADMSALFTSFSTALGNGGAPAFMTANEVRQKLNLKKATGGDTLSTGAINAPDQTAQSAGA